MSVKFQNDGILKRSRCNALAILALIARTAGEDGWSHFDHGELADELGMARNGVHRVLKELESWRWIERRRDIELPGAPFHHRILPAGDQARRHALASFFGDLLDVPYVARKRSPVAVTVTNPTGVPDWVEVAHRRSQAASVELASLTDLLWDAFNRSPRS